jgi:hypothetical protein
MNDDAELRTAPGRALEALPMLLEAEWREPCVPGASHPRPRAHRGGGRLADGLVSQALI